MASIQPFDEPIAMHTLPLTRLTLSVSALLLSLSAVAAGIQHGPAPTDASLTAKAGPYAIASTTVASPNGYGKGTVYYPTATSEGAFGLVVLAPGFTATQTYYQWLAERVASHGFVVVNINTKTILDQPESRAKQLAAALTQVAQLSQTAGTPYAGKVDVTRQAVMGHSMGGGGTLAAARDNPALKAAVPLTPWHTIKDFSGVKVPTMIVACEKDAIAPNNTHSSKFYASLTTTLDRAYVEIAGADHFCATNLTAAANQDILGKMAISWLKMYVDQDSRYTPFVTGAASNTTLSKVDVQLH